MGHSDGWATFLLSNEFFPNEIYIYIYQYFEYFLLK